MKIFQDFGVRALMGTMVVGGAVVVLGHLAWHGNRDAQITLGLMAMSALGYYFGQRSVK